MPIKFLCTAFILISSALHADTIQIASDLVDEFNNRTVGNVFITPNPTWTAPPTGAGWVSYANTGIGPGGPSHPNETVNSWTIFTENFFLPGTINSGSVRIWAEDSMTVLLDWACAGGGSGCDPGQFADISLTGLSQGEHTLSFSVYQEGNSPFGLLYSGSVDSTNTIQIGDAVATPEPSTLLMLGGGLVGLAAIIRRRRL